MGRRIPMGMRVIYRASRWLDSCSAHKTLRIATLLSFIAIMLKFGAPGDDSNEVCTFFEWLSALANERRGWARSLHFCSRKFP